MPANVVTAKGREIISARMIGAPLAGTEPLNIGWGTGGVGGPFTATVSDVAPFGESSEARVAGASSQVTGTSGTPTAKDTYQVVGTITSAGAQTIAEVLLSNSTTKPYSTTWATAPTTTSGTSGTLSASYTPANGTYIQSRGEVMQVVTGNGGTAVTVVRQVNGSTAVTQAAGVAVTTGNPPTGTGTSVQQATSDMFFHSDFTGLALSTGDSIQFTLQVQFV